MRFRTCLISMPVALAITSSVTAQTATRADEVRFITENKRVPDRDRQAALRQWGGWPAFKHAHPRWSAEFNEETGLPRRAYGDPIATVGHEATERAQRFLADELMGYRLPMDQLVAQNTSKGGKLTYVHFTQQYEGLPVLGAHAMVKLDDQARVIAFGADLAMDITVPLTPTVAADVAVARASEGLSNITSHELRGLAILPVATNGRHVHHLTHRIVVHTRRGDTPGRYDCLVDAHSGDLLYRTNEVRTCGHGEDEGDDAMDLSVTGLAYAGSPLTAPEVQGLPNLNISINGNVVRTDVTGYVASDLTGPATGLFQLRGPWTQVSTNSVTPSQNVALSEGFNQVNFTVGNLRERSAFIYVNQIHAHVKNVLPEFTGMDFQMQCNLDLTTDFCNAFYDGTAINFYAEGNNCRSLATINDVVYHEYGHGINDKYYLSLSSDFVNGAMNEGYADVWGFTLTQNPVLGLGMNLDNDNSSVRRYDTPPKVYPVDITGEVHGDGEIIAGAWWDLYELLGNDMELTLDLFAAAYPGMQAATFNGNEGQAFRDVLLDVLQADDTDGDITNGTVHGAAIVEAFAIHGITLISDAQLYHDGILAGPADEEIPVEAQLIITFPSTLYLQDASLHYKVNNAETWLSTPMTTTGDGLYRANIPAQPAGTVVAYHLGLRDIFGQSSSITPIAANLNDPGLPYYTMIGYGLAATENADDLSQLGELIQGQPEDNAITGNWEFGPPMASYGTAGEPSTIVQTGTQHTPGGQYCWYTGNALSTTSPIGDNDVDEGSTTLMGPNVDLTPYVDPAMSYWRWYTNNPPSGANPNADWWQVYASGDDGASWVPVEDTKTGERNWRRKVFRVRDVLGDDATQIRLKFIASDSVRPGLEQDGGSLVEAAVDDIELWSAEAPDGLTERHVNHAMSLWPTPTSGPLSIGVRIPYDPSTTLEIMDLTGRSVRSVPRIQSDLVNVDVSGLADGQYIARIRWSQGVVEQRFSVLH
jgi:hypothetical protein